MKKEIKKFYPLNIQLFSGPTIALGDTTTEPGTSLDHDIDSVTWGATELWLISKGGNVASLVVYFDESGYGGADSISLNNGGNTISTGISDNTYYELDLTGLSPDTSYTVSASGTYCTPEASDCTTSTATITFTTDNGVTYESNGGSDVSFEELETGDLVTEPTDPTKGTDLFLGWYTEEALTNRFDFYNTTFTGTPITLYAKWGSIVADLDENTSRIEYISRSKGAIEEALTAKSINMTGITDFAEYSRKLFTFSRDATASASEVLNTKTAIINDEEVTGTMPNNTDSDVEISTLEGTTIPEGYYNGSGQVKLTSTEEAKVTSNNLLSGVTLLGVSGAIDIASINSSLGSLIGI